MTMIYALQALVRILDVLVSGAGAIVAGVAVGRSRWAAVVAAGFAGEAIVGLFASLGPVAFQRTGIGVSGLQAFFLIASVLGFAVRATVVAGVAGVLSELRARPTPPPIP